MAKSPEVQFEYVHIKDFENTVEKYVDRSDIWVYIGVAKYDYRTDSKELLEEALNDRGIGKSHHKDDKMDSKPYKIFYTNSIPKDEGYRIEKELLDKYKGRKSVVNEIAGEDSKKANNERVILYLRLYKRYPYVQQGGYYCTFK